MTRWPTVEFSQEKLNKLATINRVLVTRIKGTRYLTIISISVTKSLKVFIGQLCRKLRCPLTSVTAPALSTVDAG